MKFIQPRDHQIDYMHFHKRTGKYRGWLPVLGTLAWHDMGLGKTLEALWLVKEHLEMLRSHGVKDPRWIVVVPKSAVPTWRDECFGLEDQLLWSSMVIVPYSQLHKFMARIPYIDIRMIVWDESHYMKAPDTQRMKTMANFLKAIATTGKCFEGGRFIQLTGTPFPNSAAELYTTWAMCCAPNPSAAADWILDVKKYEEWKITFANRKQMNFVTGKKSGNPKNVSATKWEGVANADMLNQLLTPFVHFRRREDCIDLPEKNVKKINLGLADDKLLANAKIEEPDAYMALVERLARAKTPHMVDWVRDFIGANNEQLVVFAMNRHPIEELQKQFPGEVRLITGAENGPQRAQNLKDFQEGKFRILAMTYKAGSESLNLQNCAYALYHGYPWTDATLRQGMARIYRQGQKRPTWHYFMTSGENDMRILDIVMRKQEMTGIVQDLLLAEAKKQQTIRVMPTWEQPVTNQNILVKRTLDTLI